MEKVFALVDCNNFYASCERLFRPALNDKPIAVLSNNDGCIIARSNEVKALGIPMGAPYFKNRALLKKHNVHVFSSNYALYGDLSHRVMDLLQQLEAQVEVYSIDEAFILLPEHKRWQLTNYAAWLKNRVNKCVGIPVSIGIGPTKTLAKIAARLAKKNPHHRGIFNFSESDNTDRLLESVEVADIWGIGRRYSEKLTRRGITTALHLKNANDKWLRKHLTINGLRTAMELRGISCLPLDNIEHDKKAIVSSRSFSTPLCQLTDLQEAVASYISIAAEKLRRQGSAASAVHVFLTTNRFDKNSPQYSNSTTLKLPQPTDYTPTLLSYAAKGLRRIYKSGYRYNKTGVMLTELTCNPFKQQSLFTPEREGSRALMTAVDRINHKWGRHTLQYAAAGIEKPWQMRQSHKSPAYTTCWSDLPVVKAGNM